MCHLSSDTTVILPPKPRNCRVGPYAQYSNIGDKPALTCSEKCQWCVCHLIVRSHPVEAKSCSCRKGKREEILNLLLWFSHGNLMRGKRGDAATLQLLPWRLFAHLWQLVFLHSARHVIISHRQKWVNQPEYHTSTLEKLPNMLNWAINGQTKKSQSCVCIFSFRAPQAWRCRLCVHAVFLLGSRWHPFRARQNGNLMQSFQFLSNYSNAERSVLCLMLYYGRR